jgi:signal transduction histidine kinase
MLELRTRQKSANDEKNLLNLLRRRGEDGIDVYIWIVNSYRKYNPGVVVAAIAMVLIVLLLASLQYTWLGQLSEQEFNRMQSNARMAAFRCSMEFSQGMTDLMKSLSGPLSGSDNDVRAELQRRLKAWKAATTHPELISDEITFSTTPATSQATSIMMDEISSLFLSDDLSAIAIPIRGSEHRAAIITLNRDYLASTVLPEYIHTYFGSEGTLTYDFVITDRHGTPFFRLTQSALKGNLENADVVVPLLSIPPAPLSRMPSMRPSARNQYGPRQEDINRPEDRVPPGPVGDRQRPEMRGPNRPPEGDRGANRQGLYEFRVSHRDGSLETAVNRNRLRNLGISFGVLLLLGASVVFLLLSAGRAQRLAQQQLEFVASISHELRTPLSVLKSVGENLSDGVVHEKDRTHQYGELIKGEVVRLSEMVDLALDYAAIQSGKRTYDLQPLDLTAVVQEAIREAKKRAPDDQLKVETTIAPGLPIISGDGGALRSALENLITNAIKYGGEKRWIGVEAKPVSHEQKHYAEITISDKGIGIPSSDLPHIFEPFSRGQNAVEGQVQGSGLGLSIAKHIVEAHGGTISVRSALDEGSVFTVRLPAARHDGGKA